MESNRNFAHRTKFSNRSLALLGAVTLVAGILIVLGWSFAPSSIGASPVSAANQEMQGGATNEMLAYALNFKSASNLGIFGGNGVANQGPSEIRGLVGSTGEVIGVGAENISSEDFTTARRDLRDTFSYVDQLPCSHVDDSNLGSRTFGPGVYCLSSASLAGRMTVDAGGDVNARFVFRVDGTFNADDASSIVREGGAVATNVYIFARGTATIGAGATIGANVIAREDVTVGHGSTVSGKVLSVDGGVTTDSNIVAAGTGYIEICKQLALNERTIPVGTLVTFTVTGAVLPGQSTVQVPAGPFGAPNCSPPIQVASGNQTVTETAIANWAVVAITAVPNRIVGTPSLAQGSVVIAVPDGDVNNQTVVTYTNQRTRTGTIEICKFGFDTDVTGFFNYTVQGAPGQTFSVPVGFCSAPITVTLLQQNPAAPAPTQAFTANVTELGQPNFVLINVTTFPATALNGTFTADAGFDANGVAFPACPAAGCNQNGGFANVALNIAGGATNQTTVRFFNRSVPGRIKVCKITADTVNIPIGTSFSFTISGSGGAPTFMPQTATFNVLAGPASQGGFCAFAPLTWLVGSPVFIGENGISAANTVPLPLDGNATFPAPITQAALRVSRIQTIPTPGFVTIPTAGITIPGSTAPFPILVTGANPNIFAATNTIYVGYAIINARNTTAEIEFTNYVFRPAILKLCKTSPTIAPGTLFTFTIAPVDPLTTWPYPTTAITVPVGSCTFVNGPFPANANFPGVGLFNFGTSITVTENAVAGVVVTAITSPTGTVTFNLAGRTGTLTLNQTLNNFNEISFANGPASVPPSARPARFDFDGDHTSDVAIFRGSTGTWWYAPSSNSGGGFRAVQFGQAGDVPVAADYDGDGVTDPAVYRNGTWYVLGSTRGFFAANFGLPTDIPQPGDFDGDGKADFAVYRQSNGFWYIMGSTNGFRADQFGVSTDIPVAADFDGDGRVDEAVYRSGTWYINESTNGFVGIQFGAAGDVPVQADYDGDKRADVAVFRGGTWYIFGSFDGFRAVQFGAATDTPVPADYDGDGKTDVSVFRPSNSVWYIMNSSQANNAQGGVNSKQFGSPGDSLMRY